MPLVLVGTRFLSYVETDVVPAGRRRLRLDTGVTEPLPVGVEGRYVQTSDLDPCAGSASVNGA